MHTRTPPRGTETVGVGGCRGHRAAEAGQAAGQPSNPGRTPPPGGWEDLEDGLPPHALKGALLASGLLCGGGRGRGLQEPRAWMPRERLGACSPPSTAPHASHRTGGCPHRPWWWSRLPGVGHGQSPRSPSQRRRLREGREVQRERVRSANDICASAAGDPLRTGSPLSGDCAGEGQAHRDWEMLRLGNEKRQAPATPGSRGTSRVPGSAAGPALCLM